MGSDVRQIYLDYNATTPVAPAWRPPCGRF